MVSFIFRRLIFVVFVFLTVAMITFGIMHLVPGGPFDSEHNLPREVIQNLEAAYHLDEPVPQQFLTYLDDIFVPKMSFEAPSGSVNEDALIMFNVGKYHVRWINFWPFIQPAESDSKRYFPRQLPCVLAIGNHVIYPRNTHRNSFRNYCGTESKYNLGLFKHECSNYGCIYSRNCIWPITCFDFRSDLKMVTPKRLGIDPAF